jgi:NAD-dependent dihydropyrimidine dehydrogenase PreA subunit
MAGSVFKQIINKEITWHPIINQDLCCSCGVCIEFCGKNVFIKGELATVVANPDNCVVGCKACLNECVSDALSFPDLKELVKIICRFGDKSIIR